LSTLGSRNGVVVGPELEVQPRMTRAQLSAGQQMLGGTRGLGMTAAGAPSQTAAVALMAPTTAVVQRGWPQISAMQGYLLRSSMACQSSSKLH